MVRNCRWIPSIKHKAFQIKLSSRACGLCASTRSTSMMTSSNGNIFRFTGLLWPVNSPHKGQWRGALMFCLIYVWNNSCAKNGNAGDLRRHRSHNDFIIIRTLPIIPKKNLISPSGVPLLPLLSYQIGLCTCVYMGINELMRCPNQLIAIRNMHFVPYGTISKETYISPLVHFLWSINQRGFQRSLLLTNCNC